VQIRAREGVREDLCRPIRQALGLDSFLNKIVRHHVRRIGNQWRRFNDYRDVHPSSDPDRTDCNHPSESLFQHLIYAVHLTSDGTRTLPQLRRCARRRRPAPAAEAMAGTPNPRIPAPKPNFELR
jgi:hypothetical protein